MKTTLVAAAAAAACAFPVLAQQAPRPDAGTLLEPQRQMPALPAAGGASPVTVAPAAGPAARFDASIRVTPSTFRIQGNTLFPESTLQPLLADTVGKPTNMEGLVQAAQVVRRYYRDRGYLLTEAYLPEQQFTAVGGTVVIQVLEARVGKVTVEAEDSGVSQTLASRIVQNNLRSGDFISEYALDKPVLLLRDLVGFEATASVEPGANTGEADVTVSVKSLGRKVDGLVGADNFGTRSAGAARVFATANLNNLSGWGDTFSAQVQASERGDTHLYRLGYSVVLGGAATKLGLSIARNEYALGKQFAPLGATGEASIYGLSLTQPFIRSRASNVLGTVSFERKDLKDNTATPASQSVKRVDSARMGLLGNFVDSMAGASFNSYAINLTLGEVKLDPTNLAQDQRPGGLRTAGNFAKLNIEAQRTTFVSAAGRLSISLNAQVASKNLTSAEKIGLGGPSGVRGYPVGEGVGDSGGVVSLEYRHQLPQLGGLTVPLNAGVFADYGHVKYNQNIAPVSATVASESLSAIGLILAAGTVGDCLVTTQLAWRTDRAPLSDPDKRPRVWISLQKWL